MINTLKDIFLLHTFDCLSDHFLLAAVVQPHDLLGSQGLVLSLDDAEHHLDGIVAIEYM